MAGERVFVSGGAGYVGAVLVPTLLEDGYRVTVLDLMIYGEDVLPSHPNLTVVKGDIRDNQLVKKLIDGHHSVIHLACISNDPSFELNPTLGKSIKGEVSAFAINTHGNAIISQIEYSPRIKSLSVKRFSNTANSIFNLLRSNPVEDL